MSLFARPNRTYCPKRGLPQCSRDEFWRICGDEGETRAWERKAQSFCLQNWTPVRITFSLANADSHPATEMAVIIHEFSLV